ncbi:bifunctional 4-hydroxy-2-oxoglutarate aldolase/2-dehydro-3-deoxy-phosphogluconate aldolase [Glaciecola sp. XM2]|uniref:bifunctional 4-hydroxy-2-oxoglutarate aldolase/2-dehydro-3-deoxy-phosphogluconate aldolase n=1 Tax=Glaciecola sp. XM2 TaxID=1914931 RepID=UPI001BDF5E07|nr:bifunctional 4-hydroxy-2-oxoglutarate aldolase/2-dehydro-3-deoxy-phosphogluconate aldolase [Glaciecola sp. XM2]MBT1450771.1 bifunctional 4-hydroxy-2-oxoglutarate aldolase/2-dehydro-3-deoxy-phosphogluconate aldolase [Glaciecola sp. XM2]
MKRFSELMSGQVLLPIIQACTVNEGVLVAKAMADAGLNSVEVVLRTPVSLEALKAIKTEVPTLQVGAGTILSKQHLDNAMAAGADFIVTPAVSPTLLNALKSCEGPVVPGVSTMGEILAAYEAGFRELKLFPATLAGGVKFLNAISSVFQEVTFCPTGGVNPDNKREFLALDNVFAVGGTWVAQKQWIEEGNWPAIISACREANSA